MRGQWFIDGTWLPIEEEESDLIEVEHLNHFRGQQMQDTFESDLVVKTVDSKDGEEWNKNGRGCICLKLYHVKIFSKQKTALKASILVTKATSTL